MSIRVPITLLVLAVARSASAASISFDGVVADPGAGVLDGLAFHGVIELDPAAPVLASGSALGPRVLEPLGATFSVDVAGELLAGPLAILPGEGRIVLRRSSLPFRPLPTLGSAALVVEPLTGPAPAVLPLAALLGALSEGCCSARLELTPTGAFSTIVSTPVTSFSVVPEARPAMLAVWASAACVAVGRSRRARERGDGTARARRIEAGP